MHSARWFCKTLVFFVDVALFVATVQAGVRQRTPEAESSYAPVLGRIDKVELMSINSLDGDIDKVNATVSRSGRDAQDIAAVWRQQKIHGRSPAACHQPPYAIKFYYRGKVVMFATVCWGCHNVTFLVPDLDYWVTFDSGSKEARMLLAVFQKAFGEKRAG